MHPWKYFSYSYQKIGLETIFMKSRGLFSGKNKKNIMNFTSAKLARRIVKVKEVKWILINCLSYKYS